MPACGIRTDSCRETSTLRAAKQVSADILLSDGMVDGNAVVKLGAALNVAREAARRVRSRGDVGEDDGPDAQNNEVNKSWFTGRRFSAFSIIRSSSTVHTAESTLRAAGLGAASTDA
jgi:hypothetical protein